MTRVILDTNVFVSGIFWSGPPYRILQAWQQHLITLVTSEDILNEYARVGEILAKKYKDVDISEFIKLVTIHGNLVLPINLPEPVSNDPDDDKFIACALSAGCQLIVSGDKDLLTVSGYAGIEVLKPAANTFEDNLYIKTKRENRAVSVLRIQA